MIKPNSIIEIPCKLPGNFFNAWLTFLTPIHKLTPSVIKIAAEILKVRYDISSSGKIVDDEILDKYILSNEDVRGEIIKSCKISLSNYHVGMGKLKKAGFFIDNRINPKFVPRIDNTEQFNMLFTFRFKDD